MDRPITRARSITRPPDGAGAGPAPRRRSVAGALLALALAVTVAACGGDDTSASPGTVAGGTDGAGGAPTGAPEWVQDVYPEPQAQATGELAVTVDHATLGAGRSVRLVIDGVDVTSQAIVGGPPETTEAAGQAPGQQRTAGPGQLRYDPQELRSPLVALSPGEHAARAELVEQPEFGAPSRVVDTYDWSFSIL